MWFHLLLNTLYKHFYPQRPQLNSLYQISKRRISPSSQKYSLYGFLMKKTMVSSQVSKFIVNCKLLELWYDSIHHPGYTRNKLTHLCLRIGNHSRNILIKLCGLQSIVLHTHISLAKVD